MEGSSKNDLIINLYVAGNIKERILCLGILILGIGFTFLSAFVNVFIVYVSKRKDPFF